MHDVILDNDSYYGDDFVIEYYYDGKLLDEDDLGNIESGYYEMLSEEEEE